MTTLLQICADWQPLPEELHALVQLPIGSVFFAHFATDSRTLKEGDVFILLSPSGAVDYAQIQSYLSQIQDKAVFVLSQLDLMPLGDFLLSYEVPIFVLPNIRAYLGDLLRRQLQIQSPAILPQAIAVTGTNGKTTVSQLTGQLLSLFGKKVAVMGTAGNGLVENGQLQLIPSTHTTLQVQALQQTLYDYAKQNVAYVALEASSHGLHQGRLQGVPVRIAVFCNLSRDHLDYHHNMDEYAAAKAQLFDKAQFAQLTHAIICLDDAYAPLFIQKAHASKLTVWTYSIKDKTADFAVQDMQLSLDGVSLTVMTPQGQAHVHSPLLGTFNVANVLAAMAAAMAAGVPLADLVNFVPKLQGARGRMQRVLSRTGAFIVDYAHTPDALAQVLANAKKHATGALVAVFGCGGDRDTGKRPLMTQAALQYADRIILTSDNPRSEEPLAILKDMQIGLSCQDHYKITIEPDRRAAIFEAVQSAADDDIVVIAGKGHETYQEIRGVRYDFDDCTVLTEALVYYNKNVS